MGDARKRVRSQPSTVVVLGRLGSGANHPRKGWGNIFKIHVTRSPFVSQSVVKGSVFSPNHLDE